MIIEPERLFLREMTDRELDAFYKVLGWALENFFLSYMEFVFSGYTPPSFAKATDGKPVLLSVDFFCLQKQAKS